MHPAIDRLTGVRALLGALAVSLTLGGDASGAVQTVAPLDLELDGPGANTDDPCMWVHPSDPAQSLLFATSKSSGLVEVFTLPGGTPAGTVPGFVRANNCWVEGDLLLTTDRDAPAVRVHHIPDLAPVRVFAEDMQAPMGIATLHLPDGRTHVYVTDERDASVHVYDLATFDLVRVFPTGFGLAIEPVATDDLYQRVFVAREEKGGHGIGLFTPDGELVTEFSGHLFGSDTEGMAVYACGDQGYLVAVDQNSTATQFEVFDRATLTHLDVFTLSDAAGEYTNATDGMEILQTPLPGYPNGLLAACDGCSDAAVPDETDVVSWDKIAAVVGLDVCPGGVAPDCRTAPCVRRFIATADASVSAATPDTTLGAEPVLGVDASPEEMTLLRFDLPDLTGFDLLRGTLRLTADNGTGADGISGGTLFATGPGWTEEGVTWTSRPDAVGLPLGTAGLVTSSGAVDFDVRDALRAGARDFLLAATSSDGVRYRSREARQTPPQLILSLLHSEPPAVWITGPADGTEVVPGVALTLAAAARDPEAGDVSSDIRWRSDRDGELGTGASVAPTLTAGLHVISAEIVDRAGLSATAHVLVRVNTPPRIDITSPAAHATFTPGDAVTLEASAFDAEDGDLSPAVQWSSDLAGQLGTGSPFVATRLGGGTHLLTATVRDSMGRTASTSIDATGNTAPVLGILAPPSGTVLGVGGTLRLEGTAGDADDGDLSGAIAWSSDLDGPLGTGATLAVDTLRIGTHVVTAAVVDAGGLRAAGSVTVRVDGAPTVRITSPVAGARSVVGASMDLDATASDLLDGDLSGAIRWRSDLAGDLGTGGALTVASLGVGAHVLTAAVIDATGLTADASVRVEVTPPDLRLVPAADSYVSAGAPTTNFGAAKSLQADGAPVLTFYLRFVIEGTAGSKIDRATLRLTASTAKGAGSAAGGTVYAITDTGWSEQTVTYATRPAIDGSPLAVAGAVALGGTVELDVTQGIRGDGSVVLALATASSDAVRYVSREAAGGPVLHVRLRPIGPDDPPTVAITAPAAGATVALATPVTLAAQALDREDGDLSARVVWASDLDGPLGTGAALVVPRLAYGTHRITASVVDGNDQTATASATVVVAGGVLTMLPSADATVKADSPSNKSGTGITLQLDASPVRRAYLRFPVQGVGAGRVARAILRLMVSTAAGSGGPAGGVVHALTPSAWVEKSITFATSPPVDGAALASAGKVVEGQVVELDVTAAIAGDGVYELALVGVSGDAVTYRSRENGAIGPQLVLTVE